MKTKNPMKTFAVVNRKGGVAKTTTSVELAYILSSVCSLRVLLVDADPQGDATKTILDGRSGSSDGMAALLTGEAFYENIIEHTEYPGLDLIPANDALAELDLEYMVSAEKPSFHALRDLRDALIEDDVYDVMVIDCPPNYSAACINAIVAANSIIIPSNLDVHSVEDMDGLIQQINNLRRHFPDIRIGGCLVTRYQRCDAGEDWLEYLRDNLAVPVYRTVIRRTEKVTESGWSRMSIQEYSPFSSAGRDYRRWVRELVTKEGLDVG